MPSMRKILGVMGATAIVVFGANWASARFPMARKIFKGQRMQAVDNGTKISRSV